MGDIVKGLYGGGTSGSLGYGKGNNKSQMTYLGERAGQSPLEDIMGLLASEGNQQRAQRNLLFGGGGYGGSFETEAQKAQRAAGEPVDNSKPFGGWGGYGSDNPVMAWDPTNTRPDWATAGPTPNGGSEPAVPGPTGPPGIPPDGGGGMPPLPPGPDVRDPVPPTPDNGGGMPIDPRVPGGGGEGNGGGMPIDPRIRETGGTSTAYAQMAGSKWDNPAMGDSFYRSEMKKQEAGGAATEAYGQQANAAMLNDPKIKATYAGLKNLGYNQFLPDVGELADVFSTTDLQPEDLLKHYGILIQKQGGDESRVASAGHGAEFRNMAAGLSEKLGAGLYGKPAWSTDADAANPVQPSERPKSQFAGMAFDPLGKAGVASSAPQSYDAQGAKWDRTFGKAKANAAAKAKAPQGRDIVSSMLERLGVDGAENFSIPGQGAPQAATAAGQPAPGGGGIVSAPGDPTANVAGQSGTDPDGKMWASFLKGLQQLHPEMSAEELEYKYRDWWEQGLASNFDSDWLASPEWEELYGDFTKSPGENSARPSQFGPQGFNPTQVVDPYTGGTKPIDPSTPTDKGGYAVGDAWSTSAPWRPEEPTGGLYGAYSELASGNLTPYENRIMEGWQGRATNPMGWADEKTLASIDSYEKTPGRGEDEAYGAYNDMLKGGYSAAEQNAITQEGMRAARAGFETNRDAMLRNQARTGNSAGYAANMAKMARGFGETMGSQARQNQIDFANEAERRKEGGASGMLNVAGLANQRGQTSIAARQGFGNELSRRQETAMGGMQQAAGYGRDLQQKGLQGLQGLYSSADPTKSWATAAGIGSAPRETYNETGSASL